MAETIRSLSDLCDDAAMAAECQRIAAQWERKALHPTSRGWIGSSQPCQRGRRPADGRQCWFCGQGIDEADEDAVSVQDLWRWKSDFVRDDDPLQAIYAHWACTKERMRGAAINFDPSSFLEGD
jgi:hypothetical protein